MPIDHEIKHFSLKIILLIQTSGLIVSLKHQKESGPEIGNSLIRFRRPTSAQLSRAVKADEISVVEPTQPLRLARQSKDN